MSEPVRRKKQPVLVRAQLLEAAAHVIVERGIAGLTLDLVAGRAGVSKGGLMHHFASKQELILGLFNELMTSFETAVDQCMAEDPEPRGRFFRAYVAVVSLPRYGSFDSRLLGACALAMSSDASLSDCWWNWLHDKLDRLGEEVNPVLAHMIRYASDGMWLEHCTDPKATYFEERKAVADYLKQLTYALCAVPATDNPER